MGDALERCAQCGTSLQAIGGPVPRLACPICDATVIRESMRPPARLFSDAEARAIVDATLELATSPTMRPPYWTLMPPYKPGWYWRCDATPMKPDAVRVFFDDAGRLRAAVDGAPYVMSMGGLWWSVPLDPPQKPDPDYWITDSVDEKDPPR